MTLKEDLENAENSEKYGICEEVSYVSIYMDVAFAVNEFLKEIDIDDDLERDDYLIQRYKEIFGDFEQDKK